MSLRLVGTMFWLAQLGLAMLLVVIAMIIIMCACDAFEPASEYLGEEVYHMGPGIRGASIEAVASSLPELFTTLFLLFVFHDEDGFSAGIATCAGSAIFNAALIPAICIIAVSTKGVDGEKVEVIKLQRSTLVRDGIFFMLSEILLIGFLNHHTLSWWMGGTLMFAYFAYAIILIQSINMDAQLEELENEDEPDDKIGEEMVTNPMDDVDDDETPRAAAGATDDGAEDDDDEGPPSMGVACLTFDFNTLIFGGKDFTKNSAWTVVLLSTVVIAASCYLLAESVIMSAQALDVPAYFTAVIFGAAASSVPDTIISYKNALKGDYDDAIANAIGSNIFDICFALGFPLFLYGLIHGDVNMVSAGDGQELGEGRQDAAEIQSLRVLLIIMSAIIMGLFVVTKCEVDDMGRPVHLVTVVRAYALIFIYVLWTVLIILHATHGILSFDSGADGSLATVR